MLLMRCFLEVDIDVAPCLQALGLASMTLQVISAPASRTSPSLNIPPPP